MAPGMPWMLISCGLCLALAVTVKSTTSSQTTTTEKLPQSSQAVTRETSLSVAPGHSTTASTREGTATANTTSSRNPESASAPSLSQTNTSATPAAGSSETPATDQPRNTSTSVTPAAGISETHVTDRPGNTNSTAIISSGSPRPGSVTALLTTEAAPIPKQSALSQSPGLVAVICIFVAILLIATVVIAVKLCHRREPAFKKLDEVPMGKMTEDSPFARYPPK